MQDALTHTLTQIRQPYNMVYCVACTSDGETLTTSGESSDVQWSGIHDMLFGSAASIAQLYASLEGQKLPRQFAQGQVYCVVTKLEGKGFGFFGEDDLPVMEQYMNGQQINQALQRSFQGNKGEM